MYVTVESSPDRALRTDGSNVFGTTDRMAAAKNWVTSALPLPKLRAEQARSGMFVRSVIKSEVIRSKRRVSHKCWDMHEREVPHSD